MLTYVLVSICIVLLVVLIVLFLQKKNDNSSQRIEELSRQMNELTNKNYEQQILLMQTLSENSQKQTEAVSLAISKMQESNEQKLEQMRLTVDEKLTQTLNKRLDSSFEQVSKQLNRVYESLGEMKNLSTGVTGLNKILTNVKARGTWAEVQLGNILEQTIPNMYEQNVRTNPGYNGQVEFAVKIPNAENDSIAWLPIDSKFPMEDYVRLIESSEAGDFEGVEKARKSLEIRVREEGKAIKNYIAEPNTTPFAVLYLATEGLYAEIMNSKSGIAEKLHQQGILVAGPSTITALLNSLQLGFSTIAINKKANEVWTVLGNAKKQYELFGSLLEKARKKIEEAGKTIEEADHRNSIIQKNLKSVNDLADTSTIEYLE